jgi:hypothetical protein
VNVIKIEIQSVEFTTDHNLLCNNGANITAVVSRYPNVEWQPKATPKANAPITHTASDTNKIGIKVTLTCDGAPSGLAFHLRGTSSESAFAFDKDDSFGGTSPQVVTIDSSNPIGKDIRKFMASISWTATVGTNPNVNLGSSGPHIVYTTLGTPNISAPSSASVPTPKRMDLAVPAVAAAIVSAGGQDNKPKIVWQIVKTQGTYYLGRNLSDAQAWALPSFATAPNPGADCISISRFVRNICMCMGVPGSFDAKTYMAKYATFADPNRPKTAVEGATNDPYVHSGDQGAPLAAGLDPTWILGFADVNCTGGLGAPGTVGCGPDGLNAFEAAVLYTTPGGVTWYFPGGTDSHFTDVNKVVQIFQTMVWVDPVTMIVKAVDYTYPAGGPADDNF